MATSLREVLTPLIAYALLSTRTPADRQRPFSELRGEVDRLIGEQVAAVKRLGIPAENYENARFAVVAWLDEMVLRHTHEVNPELFAEWKRSPLQVALYNTANAGEEFFERLDRLAPAQNEIAEVYYLALCLGFRGRYYDDQQEHQLVELRHQFSQRLPTPAADLFEIEKRQERVTPQPYAVQPPAPKPIAHGIPAYWYAAPIALVAVALLYVLWPSGPNRKDVEDAVRSFECAEIAVAGIDGAAVKLSGHVESEQEREQVREKVGKVRGVKSVNDDFTVIPRPFCEVMDVLKPFVRGPESAGGGLAVRPSKGCEVAYYRGETLTVDVSHPKGPLNYVYADYYTADHEMVKHVFPNGDQRAIDATSLTVSGGPSNRNWTIEISEPFGREMVTVISSPKPLFSPVRPDPETAEAYLWSLRSALQANPADPGVAAAYCFITTLDR